MPLDALSGRDLLDLTYALTIDGLLGGQSKAREELDKHMLGTWIDRETWGTHTTPPAIPPAPLRVRKDGGQDAPR